MPGSADWTGLIRIWPGGYGTAGIEFKFAGTGPAQAFLEFQPNVYSEDLCPAPPGGWTEPPPESCFYTNFLVRGVEGTFTGTLEEVPEPSTWTALGAGLMAVIGAAARRRKRGHRKIE
ncbi:MAG TPA: PEP-CTERM sorting domain-containing protein [Bryobacteraceae bacterium]|nr:PEP-CTERM sorting domain-containing protein [Bryobacteraceae bacterium]